MSYAQQILHPKWNLEQPWYPVVSRKAERLWPFLAAIAKLLRVATEQDPRDRPAPLEFVAAFADAI